VHAPGDAICLYLKEAVKPAARLRLTHLLREDVAEVVLRHGGAQLIHGLQSGRLHR